MFEGRNPILGLISVISIPLQLTYYLVWNGLDFLTFNVLQLDWLFPITFGG